MMTTATTVRMPQCSDTEWFTIFGYRCDITTPSVTARRLLRRLYTPFATRASETAAVTDARSADRFYLAPPIAAGGQWQL